jgi:hypothetical protein
MLLVAVLGTAGICSVLVVWSGTPSLVFECVCRIDALDNRTVAYQAVGKRTRRQIVVAKGKGRQSNRALCLTSGFNKTSASVLHRLKR